MIFLGYYDNDFLGYYDGRFAGRFVDMGEDPV